jgi:hypothetical protein
MVDWGSCDLITTDCRPPCVTSVSVATYDAALATTWKRSPSALPEIVPEAPRDDSLQ